MTENLSMASVDRYSAAFVERVELAMAYSDLELAYQLQLQEALAASSGMEVDEASGIADFEREMGDTSVAVKLQDEELGKVVREMRDSERAAIEAEKSVQQLKQCLHDKRVAQSISDMPEDEWADRGDEYEQPFDGSGSSKVAEGDVFQLHFNGTILERKYAGIGWILYDAAGQVVWKKSSCIVASLSALDTEYAALIDGLAFARNIGIKRVKAFGSSQLVCKQVSAVRNPRVAYPEFVFGTIDLGEKWDEVSRHVKQLVDFEVTWIAKGGIKIACGLAKEGALQGMKQSEDSASKGSCSTSFGAKTENCIICLEDRLPSVMFVVAVCSHTCCTACMTQHANTQIEQNQVPVRCPHVNCTNSLPPEECRLLLSPEMFGKLKARLAETKIPEADRLYCPYPNCSALMSMSDIRLSGQAGSSSSGAAGRIGKVMCGACFRLFCVECKVPWHDWISCSEYQQLPPDLRAAEDAKLYQLAKNLKWQRCKKCNRMIELAEGCYHMTCFCGYEFCYTCAAPWKDKKQTCGCKLWDEQNIVNDPLPDAEVADVAHLFGQLPVPGHWRNPYKTQICRFWARGYCRHGDRCTFAHGEDDLRG